jgi:hypothetical protein
MLEMNIGAKVSGNTASYNYDGGVSYLAAPLP